MTPEEIKQTARTAYEAFAAQVSEEAPWGRVNQIFWRDLIVSCEQHPDFEPANLQEQCAKAATAAFQAQQSAELNPPDLSAILATPAERTPDPEEVEPPKKGKK